MMINLQYLECVDRITKLLEVQNTAAQLLQRSHEMLNDRKIKFEDHTEFLVNYLRTSTATQQEIEHIKSIIETQFNWGTDGKS